MKKFILFFCVVYIFQSICPIEAIAGNKSDKRYIICPSCAFINEFKTNEQQQTIKCSKKECLNDIELQEGPIFTSYSDAVKLRDKIEQWISPMEK